MKKIAYIMYCVYCCILVFLVLGVFNKTALADEIPNPYPVPATYDPYPIETPAPPEPEGTVVIVRRGATEEPKPLPQQEPEIIEEKAKESVEKENVMLLIRKIFKAQYRILYWAGRLHIYSK